MEILIHASGWTGTVLIVLAYYLVSNQKLDPVGRTYQLLNLVGSVGVGVTVFYQKAWPAVALEVVWSIIAIIALMKLSKRNM